jgi:hypothetical protein
VRGVIVRVRFLAEGGSVRSTIRVLAVALATAAAASAFAQTSDIPANVSSVIDLLVSHQVFESYRVEEGLAIATAGPKFDAFASADEFDKYCRWVIAKAQTTTPTINSGRIVHPAGLVLAQCSL